MLPPTPIFSATWFAVPLVLVATLFAPAPRRPVPAVVVVCLLSAAVAVALGVSVLAAFGHWKAATALAALPFVVAIPAFWLVRGQGNDDGDGGSRRDDPGPEPPDGPSPGGIDWEALDRARAEWGSGTRPRDLVGAR